ncbi:hypothetical protein CERZMDRAFT_102569 [Cercospora zeae-maydis SCOH1-5]|uniref:Transcription elongation factor Eaf N-terminal domain-containing protein n=1 Tax=Cercospora zeae-maydis SCOH1-5 TaxID=717836 RepID=A0A6A6F0N7_9PEZI|nr:hypothetical protein CERZMDRAFT_102569 [Cercospora zeae-maydis SCOH1-5]
MAAAVQSTNLIDLTGKSQAAFPIRLGASINIIENKKPADTTTTATRYASIRYNHKPAVLKQSGDVKASIEEGREGNELRLRAKDGEYTYRGNYASEEGAFVLVLRGEGKEREMVLERLDGVHSFNLVSLPGEKDAGTLQAKWPHLSDVVGGENGGDDDLFGDDDEAAAPPDDSNPFDYRHFLKVEPPEKPAAAVVAETSRSSLDTPVVRPAAAAARNPPAATRATKPAAKAKAPAKRKTVAEKSNPKRVKAGQEPPAAAAGGGVTEPEPDSENPAKVTKATKAKPEVPKLRVDRKASIRRPSMDDSGELILENETPVTEKPPKAAGAMAWALNGALSKGPISLASAASSPGLAASSASVREVEEPQEYEFDFGDGSEAEDEQDNSELVLENAAEENDEDDADDGTGELVLEDDDADIYEHLTLPSPAQNHQQQQQHHQHRPSSGVSHLPSGEEEDDDMEKQLALAMAAEEEEEEEEESEEE